MIRADISCNKLTLIFHSAYLFEASIVLNLWKVTWMSLIITFVHYILFFPVHFPPLFALLLNIKCQTYHINLTRHPAGPSLTSSCRGFTRQFRVVLLYWKSKSEPASLSCKMWKRLRSCNLHAVPPQLLNFTARMTKQKGQRLFSRQCWSSAVIRLFLSNHQVSEDHPYAAYQLSIQGILSRGKLG